MAKSTLMRIIPADAGSTGAVPLHHADSEDHPRGCGEHSRGLCMARARSGSSPRMRGARMRRPTPGEYMGIIPADAGSTRCKSPVPIPRGDHPRGCGEHVDAIPLSQRLPGSSPRMRGARVEVNPLVQRHGIIPADAGSTRNQVRRPSIRWDHPRGCGEHVIMAVDTRAVCGSSPRMRGALWIKAGKLLSKGIIPADAGSTWFDDPSRITT